MFSRFKLWLYRRWRLFQATFRLSESAICEMSARRSSWTDFHDYPDSVEGYPDHMVPLTCKRCGKQFYI